MKRIFIRKSTILSLALMVVGSSEGQQQDHFVVLPASAAREITSGQTWELTRADIDGLEASLSQIAALKLEGLPPSVHIEHPERYFRQYVALIRAGKQKVYVNASCNLQGTSDWHRRLVVVSDGGMCYWQAIYDPKTLKFSSLRINSRA